MCCLEKKTGLASTRKQLHCIPFKQKVKALYANPGHPQYINLIKESYGSLDTEMHRMTRIILLLTTLTFLADVTAAPQKKITDPFELSESLINLENNYTNVGKDVIEYAWYQIMSGKHKQSSRLMSNVRNLFQKLAEDYNFNVATKVYKRLDDAWERYMAIFGKEYNGKEMKMRKAIFKKNMESMEKQYELFLIGKSSYTTTLNQFSDRTHEELKKMKGFRAHNSTRPPHPKILPREDGERYFRYTPGSEVPASLDWRTKGYVTPVKFQGSCASSYAFAGIGAIEGYHKKKTGNLMSLSVQNILDCTWDMGNDGCNGGSFRAVFREAQRNGFESEDQYPYTMNASRDCLWEYEHFRVTVDGYLQVRNGNEMALQSVVANCGPVAAGIGTPEGFDNYGYGVFHTSSCGPADHSVLIVGYGTDPAHGDYWIVKNSYGEWWGEDGYIRVARNKNNVCNVASHAIFPV